MNDRMYPVNACRAFCYALGGDGMDDDPLLRRAVAIVGVFAP